MMRRREFITLLGGAATWPLAARAQQPERLRRVGMLIGYAEEDREVRARVSAFEQALKELGWTSGRNVQFTYRWERGDAERMRVYAAELMGLAPDVVLTATTSALAALRRETLTAPIVFVNVTDPVGSGFVASLARPGGNITGFSSFEPLMGGKWVQLLKEIAPRATRIALISNPDTDPQTRFYSSSIEVAATSLSVKLIATPVHDSAEIESAIAALGRDTGSGLIVLSGLFTFAHRELIVRLADRYRVPAVYPYREFVESGGLLSYGVDLAAQFRQAAPYVDRILKGEKPADLPVQAPTKFELAINLKTAKALGLTVPERLLAIADRVIE
jgi:putative tryptophan/tyrosine transport system substrate-binding protein